MTKEQRTIKELTTQVADLTKQLADEKSNKEYYYKEYSKAQDELKELHNTFDLLDVPRKTSAQYCSELSLNSRMTLYIAGIRGREKDKEDC